MTGAGHNRTVTSGGLIPVPVLGPGSCARRCHGAYIDTFNPVALKVYRRAGYRPFGELPDFPKGRTRTFLRKAL